MSNAVLACSRCSERKAEEHFSLNRSKKSGRAAYCKECMKGYRSSEGAREKARVRSREYHLKNKERRNVATRVAQWQRRGLKMSMEEWQAFLDEHGERCEYPGCPEQQVSPDHDHMTGELRGILCRKHNRALGMFGDSVEGLQKAIDYLHFTRQRIREHNEASMAN